MSSASGRTGRTDREHLAEGTASALFGVEGLRVMEAEREADGTLTVRAVTGDPDAALCPDCRTRAGRVHEHVLAHPRDLRRGLQDVTVCWVKRRWKCGNQECRRKSFTESLPQVPRGCRLTGRLRQLLGTEVAERGCTPAGAARWQRVPWPTAHAAFIDQAEPVLAAPLAPVRRLGIDEHRRGRPRWRIDEDSGEYVLLADRWHTCFFDLSGDQIAAAWIGKEKLRDALNLRARVTGSTPCQRDVRGRIASFYDWCAQNDDIPELVTLARTVSRWEDQITCAVLTGASNDLASHCTSC